MAFAKDVLSSVTIAATGSTQADAAEISTQLVVPTAASTDGTKGVKLPPNAAAGAVVVIKNVSAGANNLKVYSNTSGGFIDGTAGSTAATVAQNKSKLFFCVGADTWHSLAGA